MNDLRMLVNLLAEEVCESLKEIYTRDERIKRERDEILPEVKENGLVEKKSINEENDMRITIRSLFDYASMNYVQSSRLSEIHEIYSYRDRGFDEMIKEYRRDIVDYAEIGLSRKAAKLAVADLPDDGYINRMNIPSEKLDEYYMKAAKQHFRRIFDIQDPTPGKFKNTLENVLNDEKITGKLFTLPRKLWEHMDRLRKYEENKCDHFLHHLEAITSYEILEKLQEIYDNSMNIHS